jgi:histidinol dehydrogenase
MKIIVNAAKFTWKEVLKRPVFDTTLLETSVSEILQTVKNEGDAAVKKYTAQFDKVELANLQVTKAEIEEAIQNLDDDLKTAIQLAATNIETFHRPQIQPVEFIETMPGVRCWRKSVGIERVGLYIPGGTAPLFSTVLMLGIPAKLAGCKEIILCSPPSQEGKIHPAILYTANLVGITKIFKVGGVQAIGALAYGTETIPQVYKIFGPGNQYVTAAKQLVNKAGTAIDMPAGPSEVLVCADASANPAFVAADLLSQAEHGTDSQVVLITFDNQMVEQVLIQIEQQLQNLPRKEMAAKTLENSLAIIVKSETEALDLINEYAPEHLILAMENAETFAENIINAGSIFLGHYTPESVGDYASGTNHTLPTNGFARAYSGVSVDSFVKKITFQQLTKEGLQNVGPVVERMAEAEELEAHKRAVTVRLNEIGQ